MSAASTSIRPFSVQIDEAETKRMIDRVRTTRLPRSMGDGGWSQGVSGDFMKRFIEHWVSQYSWERTQNALNAWPQYQTDIGGVRLHFYHIPGKGPSPRPLVLLHGWPSSVLEFMSIVGPLTDPEAFGGLVEDSFSLIIPSIPGFGFSSLPDGQGLGPIAVGDILHELMVERLGYKTFGLQGGDFGAAVTVHMADRHPDSVAAIHLNAVLFGARPMEDLTPEEIGFLENVSTFVTAEFDYFNLQLRKTNTVAYALSDNPVGIAAWILEKIYTWSDHDGDLLETYDMDALCGLVSFYVLSGSFDTSIRIYPALAAELGAAFRPEYKIDVPMAGAIFPKEIPAASPPRSWAEVQYDVKRWTRMPKGGHFPAMEQTELLVDDVRAFFRDFL